MTDCRTFWHGEAFYDCFHMYELAPLVMDGAEMWSSGWMFEPFSWALSWDQQKFAFMLTMSDTCRSIFLKRNERNFAAVHVSARPHVNVI
jgi:hypothetical protein